MQYDFIILRRRRRTRYSRNLIGQYFPREADYVRSHTVSDQVQVLDALRHVKRYFIQHHRQILSDVFGPEFRCHVRQIGRVLFPVHADHVAFAYIQIRWKNEMGGKKIRRRRTETFDNRFLLFKFRAERGTGNGFTMISFFFFSALCLYP